MKKSVLLLLLSSLICSGCVFLTSDFKSGKMKSVVPGDQKRVQILENAPERPFEVIGDINLQITNTTSETIFRQEVKRRAAEMGADAVIEMQITTNKTKIQDEKTILDSRILKPLNKTFVSAKAIVYTKDPK